MSSTRKAKSGSPYRQERFASSLEFERGLMANLVAKRCEVLEKVEDRELIWFLQLLSHRDGGLRSVATELTELYPERVATRLMRKYSAKAGQIYTAEQIELICEDAPELSRAMVAYLTQEEGREMFREMVLEREEESESPWKESHRKSNLSSRAVAEKDIKPEYLRALCKDAATSGLPTYLADLCLDPAVKLDEAGPWYFPTLIEALREFKTSRIVRRRRGTIVTELGAKIFETLEFALEGRCVVLLEGRERTGKTHAVKAWCEMNPGRARYLAMTSSNDEIGFYRTIAKSLGVSINLNSKAQELRQRIEDALQAGQLMIVCDEAHYLWPNLIDKRTLPARINWLMTALVNYGVPVALIATPQFIKSQKAVEDKTRWASGQFTGRIGHYERLPDSLNEKDLFAVTKAMLPEGDAFSLEFLVRYAQGSLKYLAAIESAVRRARFLAKRDGRVAVTRRDVKEAVTGSVIPSDNALKLALAGIDEKNATPELSRRRQSIADAPEIEESREGITIEGPRMQDAPTC